MHFIDLESWDRKEYFKNYWGTDFPYIIIGAHLDVTNLLVVAEKRRLSSYLTLVFAAHHTAQGIENFRYRIRDGRPIIVDKMHPSFTYMPEGSRHFINVMVEYVDDVVEFQRLAEAQIARQGTDPGFAALRGRCDIIGYSAIPWVDYTHLTRTIAKIGVDSNPKISWGKYSRQGRRTRVTFSVQVHHGLMDGYHVGRYYEELQHYIDRLA